MDTSIMMKQPENDCYEYSNKQLETIYYYSENNMAKLRRICDPIIFRKGVSQMYWDDLYSVASYTLLESLQSFDNGKGCQFDTYLVGNIKRAFYDWTRDNMRGKRCNLLRDKNGTIIRDEKGQPTVIANVSLDAPNEEGIDFVEKIDSGFKIEDELSEEIGLSTDERVEKFMESLPDIQRKILIMKMDDISVDTIKKTLGISNSEYNDSMAAIKENRLICLFNKNRPVNVGNIGGNKRMVQTVEVNTDELIMDLDTTDNHTTDTRSLESILKDKTDGELDCNYISQRDPLQWSEEQTNKYLSRLLNNQPIPEIVICETDKALYGEKISYLVEGLQRISYAEEFHENRIPVKANGSEFTKIRYRKYEYDEDGKIIKDENGRAKYTIDIFDIVGKFFKDLPEFLQKRFNNYQITITRFFNCSYEIIDYHIRNYNNHEGMTKAHYGITSVSNTTSNRIKSISRRHPFFMNNVKYTNKAKKRGVLEEMVVRSMMATFFLDDWKKESVDAMKYIDKVTTQEHYERFISNLDRLAMVSDQSVKDMFNATNIHIWIAVYNDFREYNRDDVIFIEFMKTFESTLHSKIINGRSYDEVNKRNTKDKTTVKNKINVLIDLLKEYLGIDESIGKTNTLKKSASEFIAECIDEDVVNIEEMELYEETLDGLLERSVKLESKLRYEDNRLSLLAMMAYSFKEDVDLEDWLTEFASENNTYNIDQKQNFLHMKQDFENYIQKYADIAVTA